MAEEPMCLSGGYSPAVLGCGHFNLTAGDLVFDGSGSNKLQGWNYRLVIVVRGGISILTPAPAQLLSAPHALLLCPGSPARLRVGPSCNLLHLVFSVTGQRLVRGFTSISSIQQPPPKEVWGIDLPLVLPQDLVRSAHALVKHVRIEYFHSLGDRLRSDARLTTFLAELVAKLDPRNQPAPFWVSEAPKETDPLISMVLYHARCNVESGEDWSLPTLAALAGVSVRHLHRRMARLNGGTLRMNIENMALSRAVLMLKKSPAPSISDVAASCGYQSTGTFIRAFRRRHGVTPGRWSQLHDAPRPETPADQNRPESHKPKESRPTRRKTPR
ncbi:hypothetical protein LBMAG53_33810 [Planctomycetota bacterium]|nr:hypothetical protein LBMAG53_33810 [Planctomycetota bacterium]